MPTGRITKGVGGLYTVYVQEANKAYLCQARGRFRIDGITPLVGDIAEISVTDEEQSSGYLLDIHARKNELVRPRAANIDLIAVFLAAAKPSLNLELLDSYLLMTEYAVKDIDIVICINKMDLITEDKTDEFRDIQQMYGLAGYRLLLLSAHEKTGLDELKQVLTGKTSIAAGPSGVGKSSILNSIAPDIKLSTSEISRKIERGRHTTRHAELYRMGFAADTYIADSPGFSAVSLDMIPKNELQNHFPEFRPFLGGCYFVDCSHVTEQHCAVREQIGTAIGQRRYDRYVKFFTK